MTAAIRGTGPLLKVSLRQDARNIAPWVVLVSSLSASSILAYAWLFPEVGERRMLADTLGANPALSLVFGPVRDLLTDDGFNAWRAGQLGALFAGVMAILIVVRNSRANEDSGQAELVASGVLGRQARLAVAVAMAAAASVALGVVCFGLTVAVGGGAAASATLAATFTASGLVFGGVAAINSQIGSDARTASSLSIAFLGVCFAIRGYLDSSGAPEWTAWSTPLGWFERTSPAVSNDWRPLLVALVAATLLVAAAFVLQARRDFGQGLIAPRPGPARGGSTSNVWGLAVRLNRASSISWLVGLTGMGTLFGNLAGSMGDMLAGNPAMAKILASGGAGSTDLTFAFLATILQIIAVVAAVMGVQTILRIHTEETSFRVEPLLAGAVRRDEYLAANVVLALIGTGAGMLMAGTGLALVPHASAPGIGVATVLGQAAATVPAVWLLVCVAVAAVGAAPRLRLIGWLGVISTFALTILGPTFKLPSWVLDLSPLSHVPNVSAASPEWGGLIGLAAAALVLSIVGFLGFRRRDIG